MGEQWHYTRGGQQFGPVPAAELKRMASSGDLSPTDMVWKEGMPNWVSAEKLKGLFPGSPAVTATPPPQPPAPASWPAHSQEAGMSSPPEHMPIITNNANPLKTPAITLVIAGGILAIVGLFSILVPFIIPQPHMFMKQEDAQTLMIVKALAILGGLVLLALSGVVVFGGIAMLKQTSYGLSMAGALTCSGVGLLGVIICLPMVIVAPFGIWALIVLQKPETKALFAKAKSAVG